MNQQVLLRLPSEKEVTAFWEDGVVCLRTAWHHEFVREGDILDSPDCPVVWRA